MDYSPPPLFKQGASARAKVTLFALLSIGLLFADSRLHALTVLRQVVGTVLYPLQVAALWPRDAAYAIGDYFTSLSSLERENERLKRQSVANGQTMQQVQLLQAENAQLRRLLGASEQVPNKSLLGEVLYDTRDQFSVKLVLNRGSHHGVHPGQPVIDNVGVVGQVTRVFPFTSEVTLLADKNQAIPVQAVRSGLRSVAYGLGHNGVLELRHVPGNADIRQGDVLVTSGIDGVYPAGLQVARVTRVEHQADSFAKIECLPLAGIDRHRHLLILLVDSDLPPRPEPEDPHRKGTRKPEGATEHGKAAPAAAGQAAAPATIPAPAANPAAPAGAPAQGAAPATAPAHAGAAPAAQPGRAAGNAAAAPAAPATAAPVPQRAGAAPAATPAATPPAQRPATDPAAAAPAPRPANGPATTNMNANAQAATPPATAVRPPPANAAAPAATGNQARPAPANAANTPAPAATNTPAPANRPAAPAANNPTRPTP